jgi:hypothetical protein
MVILAPALEIGPRDRRILAVADLERPIEKRIWDVTGIWEG